MMNREKQRGSALIPVMLIGLILTLVLGGLVQNTVYLEQVALENRLAEMRAYWATMGHFRYALSRTAHMGLCPNALGCLLDRVKDTDKATVLQSYLNEIAAYRTWTYADENAAYTIKINVTAAVDDDPSRQTFSGHLMMTSSYPTTGVSTLAVLSGLANRFTAYQFRFCVGLSGGNAKCGAINKDNGGSTTGGYSVKRFFRLPSVS